MLIYSHREHIDQKGEISTIIHHPGMQIDEGLAAQLWGKKISLLTLLHHHHQLPPNLHMYFLMQRALTTVRSSVTHNHWPY